MNKTQTLKEILKLVMMSALKTSEKENFRDIRSIELLGDDVRGPKQLLNLVKHNAY